MSSSSEGGHGMQLFPYDPSKPGAIIFTILFGLTLLIHTVQAFKARTLYMLTIIVATAFQAIGYLFRYLVAQEPVDMRTAGIMSQVFIVVSPAILQAQIYMIVGRMMAYVGPESTWISHSIITKVFVIIDFALIASQGGGSAFLTGAGGDGDEPDIDRMKMGRLILIGGLIGQVAAFTIFMGFTVIFQMKARQLKGFKLDPLKPMFWAFYISSLLITVRSIFRVIEFVQVDFTGQSTQGYLYVTEWPFYVLDSIPLFFATAIYNWWHPSQYLPRKKGERMDGTVEPPRKHWWSKVPPADSNIRLMDPRSRSPV